MTGRHSAAATAAHAMNALTPLQSLLARRWRPQWVCHHCLSHRPSRPQSQSQQQRRHLSTTSRLRSTTSTTTDSSISPSKPYYVTTPIFYVNGAPHVGHMYTMVLADVLKRWQELKGRPSILLTGTDEHGMKIERAAARAGVPPQEFCDKGAAIFQDLASRLGISNEIFIRTTDQKHKDAVEYAWHILEQRGYIYQKKHEGWYSVSDETFYPESAVQPAIDPLTGRKHMASSETGKEVEWTSEMNYHFRLSKFQDRLLDFYASNPDYIIPKTRMEDIITQVRSGLSDLSISRPKSRLSWGVTVPTDPSQTIYVWLDALLNYTSAVGYPFTPGHESDTGWPADVQVIGKDITRFHCIYWPAILMALDLPLQKQILTHGHWTLGKEKMAKSTGNGVNPFFAIDRFGVDVMRWYLIHDGSISSDADYDNVFIIQKYKKGLQNGIGNLLSRVMRYKGWSVPRAVKRNSHPDFTGATTTNKERSRALYAAYPDRESRDVYSRLRTLPSGVDVRMSALTPNVALRHIMKAVHDANAFFQQKSPWLLTPRSKVLAGEVPIEDEEAVDRTVFLCVESLRLVGIMLQPIMPDAAKRQLDMLGVKEERRTWEWCRVGCDDSYGEVDVDEIIAEKGALFPRLTSEH